MSVCLSVSTCLSVSVPVHACPLTVSIKGDHVGAIAGAGDGAGAPAPPHARNVRGSSRPQAGQRRLQGRRNAQARELDVYVMSWFDTRDVYAQ